SRQWFKSQKGLDTNQTSRHIAFCSHTILKDSLLIIPDTHADERFADNPLVTGPPYIRFYAGMPLLTPDGYAIGALCAMDTVPRELSAEQQDALRVLSGYVINLLEHRLKDHLLLQQNDELKNLNGLKDRLLSIIAHDLHAPLQQVESIAQLFTISELSEEERSETFADLKHTVASTRYMLNNLLQWTAKLIHNRELSYAQVHLPALMKKVSAEVQPGIDQKGNTLVLDGEDVHVRIDADVLHFVLRNLLTNANKFTRDGTITLSWRIDSHGLTVEVMDTGIGFDVDQQELFDWDKRRTSLGTDGERGSGLALIFCRDFIERHEGSISVASIPDKGSTFTIRIPQ
ncbi:MAG: GAF domain-containing sensor histidine kinase, partial [Spirochaeta sp.]